jgi:protein translocase SecG subunit
LLTFLSIAAAFAAGGGASPIVTPVAVPTPIQIATTSPIFRPLTFSQQHPFLTSTVEILFLVLTVAVILLMSIQTTKNEGLSGSIGGRAEAAYRGRLGLDQQLKRATDFAAGSWIVLAICLLFLTR